jgi:hypothetical protein
MCPRPYPASVDARVPRRCAHTHLHLLVDEQIKRFGMLASLMVDRLLGLAESQLSAMFSRGASLDAQALGAIGLASALITAVLAGAEPLFGPNWWIPLPGLSTSVATAGLVMVVGRFDLGPDPATFYKDNYDKPQEVAERQLLADLLSTQRKNVVPLVRKTEWLIVSLFLLLATFVYSGLIMGLQ